MPAIDPRAAKLQADLTAAFADVQRAQVAGIKMLAHYTSQSALSSILSSKELWLSNAKSMNDIEEIRTGAKLTAEVLAEIGPKQITALPYSTLGVPAAFQVYSDQLEAGTYVFSLSDHGRENEADRVAMWSLYGSQGKGVCVVFKREALLGQNAGGQFPAKWTQVAYGNRTTLTSLVQQGLKKLDTAFHQNADLLRSVPPPLVGKMVAAVAMTMVPAHKHMSFEAEREVRFVHTQPLQFGPLPVGAGIQSKRGRDVFVLPLRNYPEFGVNADPGYLFDHVIIEPSNLMEENLTNVRALLDKHGLQHVEVRKSDSPFRPKG